MSNGDADVPLTGGCQCGAIRYRIAEVDRAAGIICHCRMCQRAVGAPFYASVPVRSDAFAWTCGEPRAFASSSIAHRHFCADCGTTLSFQLTDGDDIDVAICTLDDPEAVRPGRETGIEGRVSWLRSLGRLPGQTTGQSMGDLVDGLIVRQFLPALSRTDRDASTKP